MYLCNKDALHDLQSFLLLKTEAGTAPVQSGALIHLNKLVALPFTKMAGHGPAALPFMLPCA